MQLLTDYLKTVNWPGLIFSGLPIALKIHGFAVAWPKEG